MPTYEYECTQCGHQFEAVQSMKDPHLTDCPKTECPGPIRRKIGRGAGIIFKGSGFYQTDYRSESYKAGQKSEAAASTGGSSSGGSSDSGGSSSSGGASSGGASAPASTGSSGSGSSSTSSAAAA
jgi:putative FmdB family regulatory protein